MVIYVFFRVREKNKKGSIGVADTGGSCKPPQRLARNFNKRRAKTLIVVRSFD